MCASRLVCFALLCLLPLIAACSRQQSEPAPLIIGAVLEVSGKFSVDNSLPGVQLAIQQLNDAGGLLGRPLKLAVADNKSDETAIAAALEQLIVNEHAIALIGPSYSNLAIAAAPLMDQYRIPFIATAATNPRVTVDDSGRTHPYAFRACFIDSAQGVGMARFARETLHAATAAVYIDDSAAYSQGLASFFIDSFSKQGGRIIAKGGYTPITADFSTPVTALLEPAPDLLFVPGYHLEALKIIRAARSAGFKGPILGGDGWSSLLLVDSGGQSLDNTFYCCHYSPDDTTAEVRQFIAAFGAFSGGKQPSQGDVMGYDAVLLLADAIRRAGSAEPAKIRDALAATADVPAVTGRITLDEHHNALTNLMVLEIRGRSSIFRERIALSAHPK